MNKKFKKILVVLLSALMVFTYMPTMAFAAVGDPDEPYTVASPAADFELQYASEDEINTQLKAYFSTITVDGNLILKEGESYTVKTSTIQPGYAYAKFTTMGNYAEKAINDVRFKIVTSSVEDTYEATLDDSVFVYGFGVPTEAKIEEAKAVQVIKNGNTELEASEYSVNVTPDSSNTTSTGQAGEKYAVKVTVPGSSTALYEKTFNVTIAKKNLNVATVNATFAAVTYDGLAKTPAVSSVTVDEASFAATDYTVSYSNNVNASEEAVATITAKATCANYTGSKDVNFTISPFDLANADVQLPRQIASVVFTGEPQTPDLGETVYVSDERDAPVLPKADYEFSYTGNVSVGTKSVTLKAKEGNNNVTGTKTVSDAYTITAANMSSVTITPKTGKNIVVGTNVAQDFSEYYDVKLGEHDLTSDDFTVAYTTGKDNRDKFGVESELTLTGKGNFTGTATVTYTPTIKPLAAKYTATPSPALVYDGTAQRPSEAVLGSLTRKTGETTGAESLTVNDYKITNWSNNINATTSENMAIATIEGKGDYEGQTAVVEFAIAKKNVAGMTATVTGVNAGSFYVGQELPSAVVTIANCTPAPTSSDYTVTAKTIDGGYLTAVDVVMTGNYEGELRTINFTKVQADVASLNNATVSATIPAGLTSYTDPDTIKNFITVTIGGQEIGSNAYELLASNITAPATVTVGSKIQIKLTQGLVAGTKEAELTVVQRDIADFADKFSVAEGGTYDGKAKEPAVSVTTPDAYTNALALTTDYTVAYTNNTDAGTATATITGTGKYKGTVTKTFEIAKLELTGSMYQVVAPSAVDRQFKVGPAVDLSSKITLKAPATGDYKDLKFDASDYTVTIDPNQTVAATDNATSKQITYMIKINANSKNYVENATGFAYAYYLVPRTVTDATVTLNPAEFELEYVTGTTTPQTVQYYLNKATTTIEVVVDGNTLKKGTDYTVTGKGDNKLPSEYTADHVYEQPYAEISFMGNYVGIDNSAKFSIVAKIIDLSNIKLVPPTEAQLIYSGNPVVVQHHDIGKDKLPTESYRVVYTDAEGKEVEPTNVGTYKATVTATADYGNKEGESIEFTITPQILSESEFQAKVDKLSLSDVEYLGQYTIAPTIGAKAVGAEPAQFEVVSYDKEWDGETTSKGKATIALKADANYAFDGTAELEFSWRKGMLRYSDTVMYPGYNNTELSDWFEIPAQDYTGKNLEPAVTAKADLSADYVTVKYYENNVNAGVKTAKAWVEVTIPNTDKKYAGSMEGWIVFTINPATGLEVSAKNATYTGKALTPEVTVKNAQGVLLDLDKDYTVVYENNTNAGKGKVTVTAMGNYAGTYEAEFTIAKAKNTMTAKAKTVKAKASKKTTIKKTKAFTVKKAQGKVTFKKASGNKKITVSKTGKVVVKKGLKKGKTFSVKVKVTAAGNKNYKKLVKTVTLKVKVVK